MFFAVTWYDNVQRETKVDVGEIIEFHIHWLWNETEDLNVLHPDNWTSLARHIFNNYSSAVFKAVTELEWDSSYDDNDDDDDDRNLQWNFEGALLYSITVITTIGI